MPKQSNGWQSGEITNNSRHLIRDAVSVRSNVHTNGIDLEIVILDIDASRDERWTSITINRRTGEVGIGRSHRADEAWRISKGDRLSKAA